MSGIIDHLSALSIVKALGGNTTTGMCPCPAHDDDKPSLQVSLGSGGTVLVHCHAGCPQEAVVSALRNRRLWPDQDKRSVSRAEPQSRSDAHDKYEEYERLRFAYAIVRAAALADVGQPERYLNGRGIKIIPENAMLLPRQAVKKFFGKNFPAMVLPIANGRMLKGADVTFLTRDGAGKLVTTRGARRKPGPILGGYVQLGKLDPEKPLIVAEGIETALSVAQVTGFPAISALSAGNMPEIVPPASTEVIIAADNDESGVGQRAAEALARKLVSLGRKVRIAVPGQVGTDWNDVLRSGASVKSMRRDILAAEIFQPTSTNDAGGRSLTTRTLDQFEYREIRWLWRPFFPLGFATTLFGDGGVGKSTITIDMAARITNGKAWPRIGDGPEERAPLGSVLILSKEDDPHSVIRPRLEAAGADLTRVHMVGYADPESAENFDPIDRLDTTVALLEQKIRDIGDVRMIIIDPATDFAGNLNLNNDQDVRRYLTPLGRIARLYELSVVIVIHMNKKEELSARGRALGGVGFINVPRSALLVADDPENPPNKIMVRVKGNLTSAGKSAVAFRMKQVRAYARVEWETEFRDVDPDQMLAGKKHSKQDQAAKLLKEWLADGPLNAKEIEERAKKAGISWDTFKKVKTLTGVRSEKIGRDKWTWSI